MRTLGLCAIAMIAACAGTKRTEAVYRQDTRRVLETRNAQIQGCYDKALDANPEVAGLVTVRFTVEKKTGKFVNATVDPSLGPANAATEPLVVCVLEAVKGLALDPPDASEGRATFVYDLQPAPPAT